ncbi:MAG: DUF512 domain-containing protein [Acidimicrobiaceae bacterium]|nr:DUF512 domain-containing protein [Acidimicrobiaceae bacterium]
MSGARISSISPTSPLVDLDVHIGDELIAVNGRAPTDIIEYQQLADDESVTLLLQREGRPLRHKVRVDKQAGAPLGLTIDSAVFDRIRTCDNHCSFCFIYQLPKGLRRSLYVKDDDFRLSFLYGNYTTLTRFTEFDLERVLTEKLSPLYVSIHTTNPELRASMLRNPRGATSLRWLRALLDAGVAVHGQVVTCPEVNDGAELERTLEDALSLYPELASLAIVPVGVSKFNGEDSMRSFRPEEAQRALETVERYREYARAILGRPLIEASDEFYLLAGRRPPPAEHFDSLDQAENGIGLVASFEKSFRGELEMDPLGTGFFQSVDGAPAWGYRAPRANLGGEMGERLRLLSGEYAAPLLRQLLDDAGFDDVEVVSVRNEYFGGNIKVAGLLTGADVARVLEEVPDATHLLPDVCLNEGRFVDGMELAELGSSVVPVKTTGQDLRLALEHWRARLVSA